MPGVETLFWLYPAWVLAVGGMIGGGIFSTLGVVIEVAGPRAWLSFLVAGKDGQSCENNSLKAVFSSVIIGITRYTPKLLDKTKPEK